MHHLFGRVVVYLGHHILLATDALGNASEEVQLVIVARFGAEDIVQRFDDL
ncbi:hypothetical protein D3C76_1614080 [compost metagenome]